MHSANPSLPADAMALARGRAYSLFGRLFLQGLKPEHFASIEAIPDLAAAAPGLSSASPQNLDRLAAGHYTLFGLNVFPHESIFLDVESNLGGPVSGEVMAFYHKAGFDVLQAGENPDHIGLELGLLAALSTGEAEAWTDDLAPAGLRLAGLQRRFLDGHLLRWLPGLARAIRQQGQTFYTALADLTLALASEHRASLDGEAATNQTGFELPPVPDVLSDEKSGLKEIARYLLTPAYSGLYLSREDISRLASGLKIPRGFGSREQMLTNLLRTAADYDRLAPLVESLRALLDDWIGFYQRLPGEQGALAPFSRPWLERLIGTQALLDRLSKELK